MDITKLLETDHRKVEELFARIEGAEGDARMPFVQELEITVRAHMELEELVLYTAMAPVTGDEEVEEGNTEHELARESLTHVGQLAPDDPGFGAALAALRAGIEHHVGEEEGTVFPLLRREGTVLERVATPFMMLRVELGLPLDGPALAASSTKDELLAEARSAGIDGVGSMTKRELADALAEAVAARA